jgi:hypothetical protein
MHGTHNVKLHNYIQSYCEFMSLLGHVFAMKTQEVKLLATARKRLDLFQARIRTAFSPSNSGTQPSSYPVVTLRKATEVPWGVKK